jgi:hypothetical protein
VSSLVGYIEGVGLLGPGLSGWPGGRSVLTGEAILEDVRTVVPGLQCLPPAERRRTGIPVKIALTAGLEATTHAGADPAQLPAIFSSSGGDGQNLIEICQALAAGERQLSPTRFHNSVHNAASGYWGIATGATAASNALCAFDASFGAGLLESMTQLVTEQRPVLLVAYDAPNPEPLFAVRPIPDAFAVALVVSPAQKAAALARLEVRLSDAAAETMTDAKLEALRRSIPAARSLPLLRLLALRATGSVVLDYLDHMSMTVGVSACP